MEIILGLQKRIASLETQQAPSSAKLSLDLN
jgi:hypothetical protein